MLKWQKGKDPSTLFYQEFYKDIPNFDTKNIVKPRESLLAIKDDSKQKRHVKPAVKYRRRHKIGKWMKPWMKRRMKKYVAYKNKQQLETSALPKRRKPNKLLLEKRINKFFTKLQTISANNFPYFNLEQRGRKFRKKTKRMRLINQNVSEKIKITDSDKCLKTVKELLVENIRIANAIKTKLDVIPRQKSKAKKSLWGTYTLLTELAGQLTEAKAKLEGSEICLITGKDISKLKRSQKRYLPSGVVTISAAKKWYRKLSFSAQELAQRIKDGKVRYPYGGVVKSLDIFSLFYFKYRDDVDVSNSYEAQLLNLLTGAAKVVASPGRLGLLMLAGTAVVASRLELTTTPDFAMREADGVRCASDGSGGYYSLFRHRYAPGNVSTGVVHWSDRDLMLNENPILRQRDGDSTDLALTGRPDEVVVASHEYIPGPINDVQLDFVLEGEHNGTTIIHSDNTGDQAGGNAVVNVGTITTVYYAYNSGKGVYVSEMVQTNAETREHTIQKEIFGGPGEVTNPDVAVLGEDQLLVVGVREAGEHYIVGRILRNNGTFVGDEFPISPVGTEDKLYPSLVSLKNGNCMVVVQTRNPNNNKILVEIREIDPEGNQVGDAHEFDTGIELSDTDFKKGPIGCVIEEMGDYRLLIYENEDGQGIGVLLDSGNEQVAGPFNVLTSTGHTYSDFSIDKNPDESVLLCATRTTLSESKKEAIKVEISLSDQPLDPDGGNKIPDVNNDWVWGVVAGLLGVSAVGIPLATLYSVLCFCIAAGIIVLPPVLAVVLSSCCCCCFSTSGGGLLYLNVKKLDHEMFEFKDLDLGDDNTLRIPVGVAEIDAKEVEFLGVINESNNLVGKCKYRGATYAVKYLKIKELLGGAIAEGAKTEIEAELRALSQLNHPNIVNVYGITLRSAESVGILSELIEGQDMEQYIRGNEDTIFDPIEKLTIMEQMLSGLAHMHKLNLVHGDIKPANIMVEIKSHTESLRNLSIRSLKAKTYKSTLIDLGNTKIHNEEKPKKFTGGTAGYVPFESEQFTPKVDMYALGLTFAEMIHWKIFEDESQSHLRFVKQLPKEWPKWAQQGEIGKLCTFIERCLEHDPNNRPDAEEGLEIIGEILANVKPEDFAKNYNQAQLKEEDSKDEYIENYGSTERMVY